MDERRQPDSDPARAEPSAWRANGAHHPAGASEPVEATREPGWSSAGAALEPSAEPLALLAAGQRGGGGEARHRQPPVPGLDDETPPTGLPATEPPLWREAARHSRSASATTGHREAGGAYRPTPVSDLVGSGTGGPEAEPDQLGGLPQRVPAEPDVPASVFPEPDQDQGTRSTAEPAAGRDRWTAPELAFIADQLRRDDVPAEAPSGSFDVDAVVAAVREVAGVQSASVRTNPTGMHTLRLDLSDDADPGEVSRAVARLLLERMGLAAAPQYVPQAPGEPVAPGERLVPGGPPAPGESNGSGGRPEAPAPETATSREAASREAAPLGDPWVPPEPRTPESGAIESGAMESGAIPAEPAEPAAHGWALPPTVPAQARGTQGGWEYQGLEDYPAPDDEPAPEPVSRPLPTSQPGPRVVIDQVEVRTFGLEATVEVLLTAGGRQATGVAQGPAVDSYLVRLAAVAAAKAIDTLLRRAPDPGGPSRCFVEHTGLVAFGGTEVAVVVLLLVCGGWVEQLTGSALVDGDPRQAVVRATLGAVNRRLEALLE